jgi:hypothetical protein
VLREDELALDRRDFLSVASPISIVSDEICFASVSESAQVPARSAGQGVKPSIPSSRSRAGSMPTMTREAAVVRGSDSPSAGAKAP